MALGLGMGVHLLIGGMAHTGAINQADRPCHFKARCARSTFRSNSSHRYFNLLFSDENPARYLLTYKYLTALSSIVKV